MDAAEETTSELEDNPFEKLRIRHMEEDLNKAKASIKEMNDIEKSSIRIIGIPKGVERGRITGSIQWNYKREFPKQTLGT